MDTPGRSSPRASPAAGCFGYGVGRSPGRSAASAPEGGAHGLDRLVRLHVVGVAAADRPRPDRRGGVARPRDVLVVDGGVAPGGRGADVEGRVAEAERAVAAVPRRGGG